MDRRRRLLAINAVAAAFSWYADSTVGASGDGRSPATAFKTLAEAEAVVGNGQRLVLMRGSTWREQLTLTKSLVTVEAGGSGAAPYIDCREAIAAAAWSKTGGRVNVYQATITLPGGASFVGNAWFDETMAVQTTSIANVDATAGTCFCSDWTATSATLYVNLPDSSNPGLGVVTVRYTRRDWGVGITGDNNTVRAIKTRGNGHADGSIRLVGQNQLVENCRLEDGSKHSLYVRAGSRVKNCEFYRARCDIQGAANFVVWNQADITAGRCYSERNTYDAGSLPVTTALLAHDDTAGHLALSLTSDSDTFSNSCGMGGNATTTTINSPVFSSAGTIVGDTNNTTINSPSGTLTGTSRILNTTIGGALTISGGSLTIAQVDNGVFNATSTTADLNITLSNVSFTLSALGSANFKFLKLARGTLTYNGCTISPTLVCPFATLFEVGISATGDIVGNNNTLPYGANWVENGSTYRNLTDWTAASGQDAASAYGSRTQVFADTFTRANENLTANANWTLQSGNIACLAVDTNAVKNTGTGGQGCATAPTLGAVSGWVESTIKTNNSQSIVLGLQFGNGSNFSGTAWSTTNFFIQRRIAGVFAQPGSTTTVTPAADQSVCYAYNATLDLGAVYVDKKLAVGPLVVGTSALAGQLAGIAGNSAVINPLLDDFKCGTLT